MYKKVILVIDESSEKSSKFNELKEHIKIHYSVELNELSYKEKIDNDESSLILLHLSDSQIKTFFKTHLDSNLKIAILPTDNSLKTQKSFGISNSIYEALDDAFDENRLSSIDLLTCNGEPVFLNVIIGNLYGLNIANQEGSISKIKNFFANLKNLTFQEYIFTTAKEQVIKIVATGVLVLEHNIKSKSSVLINENLTPFDGKLNAFILSPTNIISYLYYLILIFFYNKFTMDSIPKSIGIIKTSKLKITAPQAMDFKLDDTLVSAKEIELEVLKDRLNIALGRNIANTKPTNVEEINDTIKIHSLPKEELRKALLTEPLPLFQRAEEESFKELFISLRESAKVNSIFIVLMILSTLLATTGLFQNSAPVIIGAMILAPLMSPIVSLAMGIVRAEEGLVKNSLKTLLYGIITALIFSCMYSYFIPLSTLTDEMRGRLNPNILDLMVAIISGIAGAYANSKSEVSKSLAGVAIAVALVPPLSVTGIGIGWGDFSIIYGSFLLFLTNLVGITLFASLTFLVLGYSPINRAKKGLIYTSLILSLVTIPLVLSFYKVIKQNSIFKNLDNKTYLINKKSVNIHLLEVDLSQKNIAVFIKTKSSDLLTKDDTLLLKDKIQNELNEKSITLNITFDFLLE